MISLLDQIDLQAVVLSQYVHTNPLSCNWIFPHHKYGHIVCRTVAFRVLLQLNEVWYLYKLVLDQVQLYK